MVHERSTIRSEVFAFDKRIAVEHTTRNGDAVDDRGYIDPIRNGDAFDTTGHIDPFVRWEGHSGKVLQHYQVGGYAWHSVYCQPIHTE